MILHADFETASRLDIRKSGGNRYAEDDSTRVLMLNYALDHEPVRIWLPHEEPEIPRDLRDMLHDNDVHVGAFNAMFEYLIFKHCLGVEIPFERIVCVQMMAQSLGLPGDLDQLMTDALRVDSDFQKSREGKKLIQLFCQPNRRTKARPWDWNDWTTHPAEWGRFCEYGGQDVVAERKAYHIMRKYLPNLDEIRHRWCIAQRINERGVAADLEIALGAQKISKTTKDVVAAQMRDLSGLDNPNSVQQLLPWLIDRGYPFNNLRKARVLMALEYHENELHDDAIKMLNLRMQSSKTSVSKMIALQSATCRDGRLRGMFQFRGASRTGRYGGKIVQLQNLARPVKHVEPHLADAREMLREADYEMCNAIFDNPLEVVSSCVRSVLHAPPGKKLVVADYAAIELAVLAWLTGCKFWLNVLRKGQDPYKAFGVHFLGKAYELIDKIERNWCKPGALGSGYRLGGGFLREDKNGDLVKTGLWGYAESLGVKLTQEQAARATEVYRSLSPEIVDFWYEIESAVLGCIRDKQPRKITGGLLIDIRAPFLRIRLPSGRRLHYCRPKIKTSKVLGGRDPDGTPRYFDATNMSYEGIDQDTKQWVRQTTHGGKLTENVVQAIALDVLDYGLEQAEIDEFNVVLHVHDEAAAEVDEDDDAHGLPQLLKTLSRLPPWAEGLPLQAAGYEATWYKKD
jgi:DNA polymerase bacteriophage-type